VPRPTSSDLLVNGPWKQSLTYVRTNRSDCLCSAFDAVEGSHYVVRPPCRAYDSASCHCPILALLPWFCAPLGRFRASTRLVDDDGALRAVGGSLLRVRQIFKHSGLTKRQIVAG
jgi:hypothetical protein